MINGYYEVGARHWEALGRLSFRGPWYQLAALSGRPLGISDDMGAIERIISGRPVSERYKLALYIGGVICQEWLVRPAWGGRVQYKLLFARINKNGKEWRWEQQS